MPVSNASAQLHAIAARLKAEGEGGIKLEMTRGLRAGAQPLIPALHAAAEQKLPKSGGLNLQVAGQRIRVSVLTSARNAGVRLVTTAPDTAMTDQGFVRHPTFGRRGKGDWKRQNIPQAAGWWTKTLESGSPAITPVLLGVMRKIAARVQGI